MIALARCHTLGSLKMTNGPDQYVYHPACHCSRCLDKRQATSIKGQFRMILKNILNYKVTSNKRQAPEAASNKRLTNQDYKII